MLREKLTLRRICAVYGGAMLTAFFLFLPIGGYERMMEEKYLLFLLLNIPFALLLPLTRRGALSPMRLSAYLFLGISAVSALLSPYGTAVLLGGTRRDGLVTAALYVACFLLLSRERWSGRWTVICAAGSALLCDLLVLAQLCGGNPFGLYPDGLNYYNGDNAFLGYYAGTAGNADFTAFALALAVCVMLAALLRGRGKQRLWLAGIAALTVYVLWRLAIAAALLGLAAAAVFSLPLLLPRRKKAAWGAVGALCAGALLFVWCYGGESETLLQASALLHGRWDAGFGSGRLAIWRQLLPLVAERPLLGDGCGTLYLRGLEPFYSYIGGAAIESAITSAHNEYLGILVDQGIFALGCFIALIALALCKCYRQAENDRLAICGAALVCYAVMTAFSVSTCITAPYLWILLAIIEKEQTVR